MRFRRRGVWAVCSQGRCDLIPRKPGGLVDDLRPAAKGSWLPAGIATAQARALHAPGSFPAVLQAGRREGVCTHSLHPCEEWRGGGTCRGIWRL